MSGYYPNGNSWEHSGAPQLGSHNPARVAEIMEEKVRNGFEFVESDINALKGLLCQVMNIGENELEQKMREYKRAHPAGDRGRE